MRPNQEQSDTFARLELLRQLACRRTRGWQEDPIEAVHQVGDELHFLVVQRLAPTGGWVATSWGAGPYLSKTFGLLAEANDFLASLFLDRHPQHTCSRYCRSLAAEHQLHAMLRSRRTFKVDSETLQPRRRL